MDDLTFDFDEARAEMRGAIEAQDTEEIIRIFKEMRHQRDEAKKTGGVELPMHLERLMGQWLIKLQETGLLVEPH
jgi:tellurite resistance protein